MGPNARNIINSSGMFHIPYPTPRLQSTDRIGQSIPSPVSQNWSDRPHNTYKHILDDDSLLNVFYFCRPALLGEDESDDTQILRGGKWNRERWWYRLAHVCRRWRYLVLGSASHLGLCLLCTYGTPVADMLAHSPPLPLVLNYIDEDHETTTGDGQGPLHEHCQCIRKVTAEDEEGILLALQHRDRVRCIRFLMPVANLQNVTMAIDDKFPLLEYLYLEPLIKRDPRLLNTLRVPSTLQAPHLRHLVLKGIAFPTPIISRLLTAAVGLATLSLQNIPPSAYFPPDDLLQRLSFMPQLETLGITFYPTVLNHDGETLLPVRRPNATPITLPNLRWFGFRGTSAYLETLLPRIMTPLLDKLQISFFDRRTISPHLLQFMSSAENLRFSTTTLTFSMDDVQVMVYPHVGAPTYSFYMEVGSTRFDRQVAFAAQIFNELKTLYTVECLTLKSERPTSRSSSWWSRGVGLDRVRWRQLLRSLSNVKTLRVPHGLVRDLSRSLKPDNEETPAELLPELEELFIVYSGSDHGADEFTAFVDARQDAGRPVSVTHEII